MVLTRRAARQVKDTPRVWTRIEFESRFGSFKKLVQTTRPPLSTMPRTKAARKAKYSPYPCSPLQNSRDAASPVDASNACKTSSASRRPIRPVDRQKMLDWLREKLDSKQMPKSLRWEEEGKIFLVKWPHAARHGFCQDDDAQLYKAYAQHTGQYREGDLADHKKWKANFRCALHSLPNVKEISTKDSRKGPNAVRRFQILDKTEARAKKTSRKQNRSEPAPEPKGDDSDSGVSVIVEGQDPLPLTVSTLLQTPTDADTAAADTGSNVPNFQHLGLTTFIKPNHLSGGCVKEMPPISSPSPIAALTSDFFTLTNLTTTTTTTTTTPSPTPSSTTTTTTTATTIPVPPPCSSSSSSVSSSSLAGLFPSYFMPATTSSGTITTAASILSEGLPEELVADMKPVAIMISPRDRTPSGDSGLPESPPMGSHEVLFRAGEFLTLDIVDTMQEVDEGILTDIGANVSIAESEMESNNLEQCETSGDHLARHLLDISHSRPDSAVAVETCTHDDFIYAGLPLSLEEAQ